MPLSYSSEQEQIRAEARRFLEAEFNPDVQRRLLRQRGQFDTAFWQSCIDMGWTGAGVPEAFGGLGLSAIDVCIIAEECGRFVAGAPFLAANFAAARALVAYGDERQQAAFLPRIACGEARFALALFEDEGELPDAPSTRCRDRKISGRKCAVAGAATATHALVLTDAGLCIADLDQPGLTREAFETLDNTRCTADIVFSEAACELLTDEPGAALQMLAIQATVTAFEQIGGAEAAMARARLYANTREAFGQPIGKFQAIKHRVAEMYVAIELARGNALLAATALQEKRPEFILAAAAARLAASDAFEFAAAESIQTHGAIGVTWEHDLHLYLRRARALALELGSSLYWEDIIVQRLADASA